jgi:phosphatidylglycerol:prolipoprotein diacylglycerol transferase
MNFLFINFPSWLKPEIIPGLPVRWYGLMYIVAFVTAWYFYRRQVRERRFPMSEDDLVGMFAWNILGLVLGARLLYCLVYETSGIYLERPYLVFWPFNEGRFTGLAGMSYHGGVLGGALSIIIYCFVKKRDTREIIDMYAASIPIGYTFGRLGNFINAELYGRVTQAPWGMVFPAAQRLSATDAWVAEAAAASGIAIPASGWVNLPRHPSQLYEAFLEGIFLWLLIWAFRNRKPFKGFLTCLYIAGYGLVRFFIEYFREPDGDLGYRFQIVQTSLPLSQAHPTLSFSTGQVFCFVMIAAGLALALIFALLPDRKPVRLYTEPQTETAEAVEAEKRQARNNRRKLRKKLR